MSVDGEDDADDVADDRGDDADDGPITLPPCGLPAFIPSLRPQATHSHSFDAWVPNCVGRALPRNTSQDNAIPTIMGRHPHATSMAVCVSVSHLKPVTIFGRCPVLVSFGAFPAV